MTPLMTDSKFSLLYYVTGRVFPQEPTPPKSLGDIAAEGQEHRAAVTHCADPECFMTFDLAHVRPEPPYVIAHKWWMSLSRARAIAHALWFARD